MMMMVMVIRAIVMAVYVYHNLLTAGLPYIRQSTRVNSRASRDPITVVASDSRKKGILAFSHSQWAHRVPHDRAEIYHRFFYYKPQGIQVLSALARETSKPAFYVTSRITLANRGAPLCDCTRLHREGPSLVSATISNKCIG